MNRTTAVSDLLGIEDRNRKQPPSLSSTRMESWSWNNEEKETILSKLCASARKIQAERKQPPARMQSWSWILITVGIQISSGPATYR